MNSSRLKDKLRHIQAMRSMTGPQMVEYLRHADTFDSVVWQQLALRVSEVIGRLPDDLHNRMMMEPDDCAAKREYVEDLSR